MKNRKSRLLKEVLLQSGLVLAINSSVQATEKSIDEYLDMDLNQLMEIKITSVSKKEQTLSKTAAAVYVISQEDIRKSGVTSIPAALAMAPGVHVAQISASMWSVSARGFSGYTSNKLLVLIDGRSVYSPAFSGTFWDVPQTLLEDIDRIEVIRGPGGTIWGANAVNGVINIITKKAENTLDNMVRVGVGTEEKFTAAARVGGRLGENSYGRIYVTGNDRDSNARFNSDEDGGDGWQNIQAGFRTDGSFGSDNEWTIQGDIFQNKGDQVIYPYWLPSEPYLIRKETDVDSGGMNLSSNVKHQMNNGQKLALQFYYSHVERDEDPYVFDFDTVDLDLQYEAALGESHNVTLGAGYRYIDASIPESFMVSIPDNSYNLYTGFIQDEMQFYHEQLIATVGLKWEYNDFTGDEWQPSVRVLYKPTDEHSVWIAASRAVRTPSMVEDSGRLVFGSFPSPAGGGVSVNAYGSSDFESEEVYAYELGHRWQIASSLSSDLAVFYNEYDDLYSFKLMDQSSLNWVFSNEISASNYGAELSIKWQPQNWLNFDLTYTYLEFDIKDDQQALGQASTSTFFDSSTPTHQFGLRSSVDLSKNWQFNFWLRWQDETETRSGADLYQSEIVIDDFFVLDANIIWRPKPNIEFMLAGHNLSEDSQLQYVSELITAPTEVERGVYAKLTWYF